MSSSKNEKSFWIQLWTQGDTRKIKLTIATTVAIAMVGIIVTFQNLDNDLRQTEVKGAELPPITVFPDFASIQDLSLKKLQFFDYLEDHVVAESQSIIQTWRWLKQLTNLRGELQDLRYKGIIFLGSGVMSLAAELFLHEEELEQITKFGLLNRLVVQFKHTYLI